MKKKLFKITIFLVIFLVPVGLVLSNPSRFWEYKTLHGGGCHSGSSYPANPATSGIITLTAPDGQEVGTGAIFTVKAQVTGFDASGFSDGDDLALAFLSYEEDNGDFIFSPTENSPYSLTITSGNSIEVSFTVTAPLAAGDYTIKATVLYGGESGDVSPLSYIHETLDIVVSVDLPTSYISAANYLVNTAEKSAGGYRWEFLNNTGQYNVGWGEGVAGVGDFLIEAYNKSEDSLFLNYSVGAARWLYSIRYIDGNGTHWDRAYDVNNDPMYISNYTGISQGSAGIGKFFLNLYRYTNNDTYRDWAEKIAQYLKNEDRVVADSNEMAWRQDD